MSNIFDLSSWFLKLAFKRHFCAFLTLFILYIPIFKKKIILISWSLIFFPLKMRIVSSTDMYVLRKLIFF